MNAHIVKDFSKHVPYYLKDWEEIVGTLKHFNINEDTSDVILHLDNRCIILPRQHVAMKSLIRYIHTKIGILRTNIPSHRYLIRQIN